MDDKLELLKKISALDMVAIDLHLYLNTHPKDQAALSKYNSVTMESQMLRKNYEKKYGMLTMNGINDSRVWQWIDEPWPWEYKANYRLS